MDDDLMPVDMARSWLDQAVRKLEVPHPSLAAALRQMAVVGDRELEVGEQLAMVELPWTSLVGPPGPAKIVNENRHVVTAALKPLAKAAGVVGRPKFLLSGLTLFQVEGPGLSEEEMEAAGLREYAPNPTPEELARVAAWRADDTKKARRARRPVRVTTALAVILVVLWLTNQIDVGFVHLLLAICALSVLSGVVFKAAPETMPPALTQQEAVAAVRSYYDAHNFVWRGEQASYHQVGPRWSVWARRPGAPCSRAQGDGFIVDDQTRTVVPNPSH